MKILILLVGIYSASVGFADSGVTAKKTLVNNFGFEVQFPACWEVSSDDPDQEGSFSKMRYIFVGESASCKTEHRRTNRPNGVSISVTDNALKSAADFSSFVKKQEDWFENMSKSNFGLLMKSSKSEDSYSYSRVFYPDSLKSYIRWEKYLYCRHATLFINGPSLDAPVDSYLKKFKLGDLAMPEPEKSIVESIKCIEPKTK